MNYVNSNAGVTIATGNASQLVGTGGHAEGDELYGIENILGSEFADDISMWDDAQSPVLRGRTVNRLEGLGGNDILRGGAGEDTLLGGDGADKLFGGSESDIVDGNVGIDFLDGGAGTDAAEFSDVSGNVNIKKLAVEDVPAGVTPNSSPIYQVSFVRSGSTETDKIRDFETIRFDDGAQKLLLEGDLSVGQAKMLIDAGGGVDGVDFSRLASGLTTQIQTISALEYVVVNGSGAALRNVEGFVGTKFADTIATNEGNQLIYGRDGADIISVGIGADTIEGGIGDDRITAGTGDDKIIVGQGIDTIFDAEAGDRLFIRLPVANGTDPETSADASKVVPITGGFFMHDYWDQWETHTLAQDGAFFHPRAYSSNNQESFDPLQSSLGANYSLVFGLTGADLEIYISFSGVDWTYGAPHINTPDAQVLIKDFENGDFGFTFTNLVLPFNNELGFITDLNNAYKAAHNALINSGTFETQSVYKSFQVVQTGTSGSDNVAGSDGDDRIEVGGGNDTITAVKGDDRIDGGSGDDVIDAGEGNDEILGKDGEDTIEAGEGNDSIDGGADNDAIFAEDGDDIIIGGQGDDWIVGGDGDDTITMGNAEGGDTLVDFAVTDDIISIWVSNVWDYTTLLNYAYEFEGDTYVDFWESGTSMRLVGVSLASLDENNFTFAFVGTADGDYIEGTTSDDNLVGLAGADILIGSDGNDIIVAGDGDDELGGGSGNDRLDGGAGNDAIDGSDGADTYVFGIGYGDDSIIDWGIENDTVEFGPGILMSDVSVERGLNDFWDARIVLDTGGSLTITGQFSDPNFMMESFRFDDGTEWAEEDLRLAYIEQRSTDLDDDLHGFYVEDVLDGKDGNDTVNGDAANDTIIGGYGDDLLTGGSEEDTFIFSADFGLDTITDFEGGAGVGDIIQFNDGIFADFNAVMNAATQIGSDVEIAVDAYNMITLENVTKANLNQDDFLLF